MIMMWRNSTPRQEATTRAWRQVHRRAETSGDVRFEAYRNVPPALVEGDG